MGPALPELQLVGLLIWGSSFLSLSEKLGWFTRLLLLQCKPILPHWAPPQWAVSRSINHQCIDSYILQKNGDSSGECNWLHTHSHCSGLVLFSLKCAEFTASLASAQQLYRNGRQGIQCTASWNPNPNTWSQYSAAVGLETGEVCAFHPLDCPGQTFRWYAPQKRSSVFSVAFSGKVSLLCYQFYSDWRLNTFWLSV